MITAGLSVEACKLTILAETDSQAGHRVCDGACESERVVQVMMVVGEIIELDLLNQKRTGHVSKNGNTVPRKTHGRTEKTPKESKQAEMAWW